MHIPRLNLEPAVGPIKLPHPSDHEVLATSVNHQGEAVRFFVKSTGGAPRTIQQAEYAGVVVVTGASGSFDLWLEHVTAAKPWW